MITRPRYQKETQLRHCLRFKIPTTANSEIIFSYHTIPHYHYGTWQPCHTEHDSNRIAILACWLHTSYLQRSINTDRDRCGTKDTYSYRTDQNRTLWVAYCNRKRRQNTSHSMYIKHCFCTSPETSSHFFYKHLLHVSTDATIRQKIYKHITTGRPLLTLLLLPYFMFCWPCIPV